MDYIYTAFHRSNTDGTPVLNPLWFKYPNDTNTFAIDLQFLYGDSILVSPVTDENATSVDIYLPKDIFYAFPTFEPVQGLGANVTLSDVNLTSIPVHIRGGAVLPLRVEGAMTTAALRSKDFEFVVAPGTDNVASGTLYFDDGVSVEQSHTTDVQMEYAQGMLAVTGSFGRSTGVKVASVSFLNTQKAPTKVEVNGQAVGKSEYSFDASRKVLTVTLGTEFNGPFKVSHS